MKRGRFLWIAIFATMLLASLASFLLAGYFISSPVATARKADVLLALGGDNGDRITRVVELFQQDLAPRLLLTGLESCPDGTRQTYLNWRVLFATSKGVPKDAILYDLNARNSWEEAVNTLALLKREGWNSVLIVSDPPHMRRLDYVWTKVFHGSGKEFILVQSNPYWWNPGTWWRTDQSAVFVISEYVKLIYYLFKY